MLLILEGPDGAGKTTLAQELSSWLLGAVIAHHGPAQGAESRELCGQYMTSLRPALGGQSLILDRSWLSEPIYAEVYRGAPSRVSSAQRRMLERAALACGGVVVRCLPPFEVCAEAFSSGRDEMLADVQQLRQVHQHYQRGLDTWLPVVDHDFTKDGTQDLLARLDEVVSAPRVQLIGDRANVRNPTQTKFSVPFVAFNGLGCSEWLAHQLDSAGVPESDLEWFNAYDSEGTELDPVSLVPGLPVIALGRNASAWCTKHGVSHELCPHPQSHKRFYYDKPYPLLKTLERILK